MHNFVKYLYTELYVCMCVYTHIRSSVIYFAKKRRMYKTRVLFHSLSRFICHFHKNYKLRKYSKPCCI